MQTTMQTITIAQTGTTATGFEAKVTIGGAEFAINVSDPFASDPQREARLEWYFEEWIRFPFTDTTIAQKAAVSVKEYGVALFEQVFGDRRAFAAYQQVAGNLSQLEIVIQGDPAFQGLHWEALWDGEMARPLSIDAVMVRQRRTGNGLANVQRQDATELNLLVVTARPDEDKDVGYRTISRPLVAGIANAQLPVNVEFVRPGTYEALVRQLDARGQGYYHMVHFDMHGVVTSSHALEQANEKREKLRKDETKKAELDNLSLRYGYELKNRGYDLKPIVPEKELQGFLLFESDESEKALPVTAQEMSDRLKTYGIAACVLNACQSGKQGVDVSETSLGARLMDAGMQMVVAMAYSVTVDAAKLLVTQLYGQLFAGVPIDRALQRARRELHGRKSRSVYFGQKVDLEDWLLPVVYRNQAVDLKLRRMYPEESEAYFASQGARFQFGRQFQTEYGFVGRDLEILQIEKGLIRDGNVLMLYGMGGTGKTTLLRYLQDWWVQTGFVAGVSYFGYDQRAWTLAQILFGVAQDVMTEGEMRSFQSLSIGAQVGQLVQVLRSRPWLIVLDNLESVMGQALAIMHTLTAEEREPIRDFVGMLRGGQTRVLLGSRRREDWLGTAYGGNEYELRGLDAQARTALADAVLAKQVKDGAQRRAILADQDFGRLMKLLAGYPLAIAVVLGNLGRQSVGDVLAGLDAADVSLDRAGSKTESILQCVEYSHGNLSESAQRVLLCLALFSGFVNRVFLPQYLDELRKLAPFQDYQFEDLDSAVTEAINWGLLAPHEIGIPELMTIQPVFPYFLKTRLRQEDTAFQEALKLGFKNHYEALSGFYRCLVSSKEPQDRKFGIIFHKLEYENLYNALQIALRLKHSIRILFCLSNYFEITQDHKSRLQVAEEVCRELQNYPQHFTEGDHGSEVGYVFHELGSCNFALRQYPQAKKAYQNALKSYERLVDTDPNQKKSWYATTYHQMGNVAHASREIEEARQYNQKALQIYTELNDHNHQAGSYQQLGLIEEELREFEGAREHYYLAIDIFSKLGDDYAQAGLYHHLGRVAEELREFKEAQEHYYKSIQIRTAFGDRHNQARTYGQLGAVFLELREFGKSRYNYQQALQICIEFNDFYEQANLYHQLGNVSFELREFEEAGQSYKQALNIFIQFDDHLAQASTCCQLGDVMVELQRFEGAKEAYQKALSIYIQTNDPINQANAHYQLGKISKRLRQWEEARQHYRASLNINIELNHRLNQASNYFGLASLAELEDNLSEATTNFQQALERYIEYGVDDWADITKQRIALLGVVS
jgi:tetratricopeptide (TPR) repeat protein